MPPPQAANPHDTRRWCLWITAAVVFTCLTVAFTYDVPRWSLSTPLDSSGDSVFFLAKAKMLMEPGGVLHSDRLAAPLAAAWYDFPSDSHLHWACTRLVGLVSRDPVVLVNATYLLSFPLITLTTMLAMRAVGMRPMFAALTGLLFATQAFHYWRGVRHLNLSCYALVPLGLLLCVWVFQDRPLFFTRDDQGHLRWTFHRWPSIVAILTAVLVGLDFAYFVVFAGLLLCMTIVTSVGRCRHLMPAARGAVILGIVGMSFLVNLAPTTLARQSHGPNLDEQFTYTQRHWRSSERWGLRLAAMLAPAEYSRLPGLAAVGNEYRSRSTSTDRAALSSNPIGFVASLGLLAVLLRCLLATRIGGNPVLMHLVPVLTVGLMVIASTGGLGMVFSLLVTPVVRCYDRMGLLVALLSLVFGLGMLSEALGHCRSRGARVAEAVVGLTLLVVGAADQIPRFPAETWTPLTQQHVRDAAFFGRIEDLAPEGQVFQWPHFGMLQHRLPKAVQKGIGPYGHLLAFIHTSTVHWSFGGVPGRPPSDLLNTVAAMEPTAMVAALANLGFTGIEVDRRGCDDGGRGFEAALAEQLGGPSAVSEDGARAYYSLTSFTKAQPASGNDG